MTMKKNSRRNPYALIAMMRKGGFHNSGSRPDKKASREACRTRVDTKNWDEDFDDYEDYDY